MKNKWTLLGFLCGIFVVYTVVRALLGILALPIQQETGISNVQVGVLSAAIFWTYAVAVPFSGVAGDRFDRGRFIAVAAMAWSAMTVLAGFASGFWSLFALVSVAVVIPQTVYGPTASALIAAHHVETRTIALSCHQAAYYVGWFASGAAVAGVVALFGSWRSAFVVFGLVGFVLGAAFLFLNRRKEATASAVAKKTVLPSYASAVKAFFCCPTAVLCGFAYVSQVFVSYGYSSMGPKFIAEKFHLSAAEAGTGVMFWHYGACFAAVLAAGALTDRVIGRWPRARMVIGMFAMGLAIPALVCFGCCDTLWMVWTAAVALGVAMGVLGANQVAMVFDVVAPSFHAGTVGFMNVMAGLIGSLAPIMLGALSQQRGQAGFEIGFSMMGLVLVVGIAVLVVASCVTYARDRARIVGRPEERSV